MCYDQRQTVATCTITGFQMESYSANVDYPERDKTRFYMMADVPELGLTDVQLFPDCRYIIRSSCIQILISKKNPFSATIRIVDFFDSTFGFFLLSIFRCWICC